MEGCGAGALASAKQCCAPRGANSAQTGHKQERCWQPRAGRHCGDQDAWCRTCQQVVPLTLDGIATKQPYRALCLQVRHGGCTIVHRTAAATPSATAAATSKCSKPAATGSAAAAAPTIVVGLPAATPAPAAAATLLVAAWLAAPRTVVVLLPACGIKVAYCEQMEGSQLGRVTCSVSVRNAPSCGVASAPDPHRAHLLGHHCPNRPFATYCTISTEPQQLRALLPCWMQLAGRAPDLSRRLSAHALFQLVHRRDQRLLVPPHRS